MQQNYQVLNNNKYIKIIKLLNNISKAESIEKRNEIKENAIKTFKIHLKLFTKYYFYYEQSDNIIKQYEESGDLSRYLKDDYDKIKKQIDNLNRIGFREIFETVKQQAEREAAQNDNNELGLELNDMNNGNENLRRMSTVYVQEALNRDEFLKKREEELQEIHIIAKEIKDTTQNMALKVNQQGEQLNLIENNVEKTLENTKKAHEEIKEADKLSSQNKKKMCWLICIISTSILAISAIILSLIFGT